MWLFGFLVVVVLLVWGMVFGQWWFGFVLLFVVWFGFF